MADQIHIDIATMEDAPVIGVVVARAYAELLSPFYEPALLTPVLGLISHPNEKLIRSGRFYVARDGAGKVVGCGGWSHGSPGRGIIVPGTAHVRHFAVDPGQSGRGIGGRLLRRSLREAKSERASVVMCDATLMAEAFYAGHGFQTEAFIRVPMGSVAFPCVRMRLAI
ncbi:MAG: GNAT family N-acetyltransferase [Pseudomonadota bacterium]